MLGRVRMRAAMDSWRRRRHGVWIVGLTLLAGGELRIGLRRAVLLLLELLHLLLCLRREGILATRVMLLLRRV